MEALNMTNQKNKASNNELRRPGGKKVTTQLEFLLVIQITSEDL